MSARRNISTFNMSFLDMMTAALVAMMLLFIISDGSIVKNNSTSTFPTLVKAKLNFDKESNQVWGEMNSKPKLNDTLLVVVNGFEKFPSSESAPIAANLSSNDYNAKVDSKTQVIISKDEYNQLKLKKGIPPDQKLVSKNATILTANQTAIDKSKLNMLREVGTDEVVCKANKCKDCQPSQSSPKCVSCMGLGELTFQIDWTGAENNADLYVERVGGGTVSYKNTTDKQIGIFIRFKTMFGKGVKTSEVVYQEAIIPGTFNIYASVFKSKQPSVNVRGVVCGRNSSSSSVSFESKSVPVGNSKVLLGTVTIGANGSITK
jgi:hypothetical protein